MVPTAVRDLCGYDQKLGVLLAQIAEVRQGDLDHYGLRQRRLGGRCPDHLEMGVIATVRLIAVGNAASGLLVWRGMRRGVFRSMLVRETVDHLRKEKAKPQEERQEEPRYARAAQAVHWGKITPGSPAWASGASVAPRAYTSLMIWRCLAVVPARDAGSENRPHWESDEQTAGKIARALTTASAIVVAAGRDDNHRCEAARDGAAKKSAL